MCGKLLLFCCDKFANCRHVPHPLRVDKMTYYKHLRNGHTLCMACPPTRPREGRLFRRIFGLEASIRTLSVSLLAVAAIAASLVLSRNEGATTTGSVPAGETMPGSPSLDKIRAAGL